MLMPTFIYQPSYPKSSKRSIIYLLVKAILFVFAFAKGYQVASNHIFLYAEQYKKQQIPFIEMYLRELLPLNVLILMLIIMIFDFMCTFFAELYKYPDHQFYEDFWNSTTMSEFLSKMTCIIPNFFKIHVVYDLVHKWGIKLKIAKFISLCFSVAILEMLMVFIFKVVRPYLFTLSMISYPIYRLIPIFKVFFHKANIINRIGIMGILYF